jgi:hypothetical protein
LGTQWTQSAEFYIADPVSQPLLHEGLMHKAILELPDEMMCQGNSAENILISEVTCCFQTADDKVSHLLPYPLDYRTTT